MEEQSLTLCIEVVIKGPSNKISRLKDEAHDYMYNELTSRIVQSEEGGTFEFCDIWEDPDK